jgi:UDP-N-acetyl-D-mannosaminuronate dehydrogenase
VRIHDPFVADYAGPLEPVIDQADALLVLVAHEAYRALDLASLRPLMRAPVLVDGRHVVSDAAARAAGFDLVTVGVGRG